MSQIVHRLKITHHFREGVNCMLRYVLAQPVESDVVVILYLMAEYTGISKWKNK